MSDGVVSRLPSSVVSAFADTVVDTAYEYALAWRDSLESVSFTAYCGEFKIQIPASETDMFENRGTNQYEPDLSARLCDTLTADDVFCDVGSHWGYYAVLAAECGVSPQNVHRFESDLFYYLSDANLSEAKTNKKWAKVTNETASRWLSPDSVTLDDYFADREPPSVIKMDIQGAEYLALDGLSKTMDERRPELFVEVHPHLLPKFGHTAEELIEYLESKGYRLEYQVGDEWTSAPSEPLPEDDGYFLIAT